MVFHFHFSYINSKHAFWLSAFFFLFFFQNQLFSKYSFRNTIRASNSLDLDQVDILSGLIWVLTICKDHEQMTNLAASRQQVNTGIKHAFSCINILQVPKEMLKTEGKV